MNIRFTAIFSFFVFFGMSISIVAQATPIDSVIFDSPVKHKILLGGSFGELRTTHFHAGVDIKPTSKAGGDSLFVAGAGHVSRIKIQTGGYGRCLYVDHPNGYTTVYAHMMKFTDSIEAYIQSLQLASESYEVDIYPQQDKFVLDRFAYIGLLGNTGRSYGAHLHFEIRDTKSETPINPGLFGITAEDHRAPDLTSVNVYGMDPDWQETYVTNYPTKRVEGDNYTISNGKVSIPAWRAGVAVQGWDRMDGASNKNGIYQMEMKVDDKVVYTVKLDSVNWEETGYIKSHVDYADRQSNKRTAVRCHHLPGNKLSIYDSKGDQGIFKIYESKERKVAIKASDIEGNVSTISFGVVRDTATHESTYSYQKLVKYDMPYDFKLGSSHIVMRPHTLDRNLYMEYSEVNEDNKTVYHLHSDVRPLYQHMKVTIPIKKIDTTFMSKLCVVSIDNDALTSYGGDILQDSIMFSTATFGDYTLHYDTISPIVTPFKSNNVSLDPIIKYIVKDDIKSANEDLVINVYINGNWVISPFKVLDYTLEIDTSSLLSGSHDILIVVEDPAGNKTEFKDVITLK